MLDSIKENSMWVIESISSRFLSRTSSTPQTEMVPSPEEGFADLSADALQKAQFLSEYEVIQLSTENMHNSGKDFNETRDGLYNEISTMLAIRYALDFFKKFSFSHLETSLGKNFEDEIYNTLVRESETAQEPLTDMYARTKALLLKELSKSKNTDESKIYNTIAYHLSYFCTYISIHILFPICHALTNFAANILKNTVKNYFEKNPSLPIESLLEAIDSCFKEIVGTILKSIEDSPDLKIKGSQLKQEITPEVKTKFHKEILELFYQYSSNHLANFLLKTLEWINSNCNLFGKFNLLDITVDAIEDSLSAKTDEQADKILLATRQLLLNIYGLTNNEAKEPQLISDQEASADSNPNQLNDKRHDNLKKKMEFYNYVNTHDKQMQDITQNSLMAMHYLVSLEGDPSTIANCSKSNKMNLSVFAAILKEKLYGSDSSQVVTSEFKHNLKETYHYLAQIASEPALKFLFENVVNSNKKNNEFKLDLLRQALHGVKGLSKSEKKDTPSKLRVRKEIKTLSKFIIQEQCSALIKSIDTPNSEEEKTPFIEYLQILQLELDQATEILTPQSNSPKNLQQTLRIANTFNFMSNQILQIQAYLEKEKVKNKKELKALNDIDGRLKTYKLELTVHLCKSGLEIASSNTSSASIESTEELVSYLIEHQDNLHNAIYREFGENNFTRSLNSLNVAKSNGQLSNQRSKEHLRSLLNLFNALHNSASTTTENSTANQLKQCIHENLNKFNTATTKNSFIQSIGKLALSTFNSTIEKLLLKKTENLIDLLSEDFLPGSLFNQIAKRGLS